MKTAKRLLSLLLLLVLLAGLCACGSDDGQAYRVIEELGTVQYGTVFRLDDKVARPVIAAMQVLAANGTLSTLSSTWLGRDITCLKGDIDALSELRLTEEIAPRTLIVGVESDFRPIAYENEGGYTGLAADIAAKLGELLGWEIRIQPITSDGLVTQLVSGNIDCALGFDVSGLSAESYTIGDCFMQSEIVLAVPRDSDIKSVRGLKNLKIGSVKGTAAIVLLQENEKVAKYAESVTAYLSPIRCLNALGEGWCAAVAMDSIMLASYYS